MLLRLGTCPTAFANYRRRDGAPSPTPRAPQGKGLGLRAGSRERPETGVLRGPQTSESGRLRPIAAFLSATDGLPLSASILRQPSAAASRPRLRGGQLHRGQAWVSLLISRP